MITILTIKTDSQWEDSVDEHGDSNVPLVFSREEDSKFPDLIPLIEDQGILVLGDKDQIYGILSRLNPSAEHKVNHNVEFKVYPNAEFKVYSSAELRGNPNAELRVNASAEFRVNPNAEFKVNSNAVFNVYLNAKLKINPNAEFKVNLVSTDRLSRSAVQHKTFSSHKEMFSEVRTTS
jgi:hypothetical protein